jgi:hypothetical protein
VAKKKLVLAWRGRIRALLKDGAGDCQSLLNWNAKNPESGLFTTAQATEVQTVVTLFQSLVALKVYR